MRRRIAIEPVIGHVKAERRIGQNCLRSQDGNRANVVTAAPGYNFDPLLRQMAQLWRDLLKALALVA